MKLINKQTIIAALVGGVSALALTASGVALAHGGGPGGPHGKGGPWSEEKITSVSRSSFRSCSQRSMRPIWKSTCSIWPAKTSICRA